MISEPFWTYFRILPMATDPQSQAQRSPGFELEKRPRGRLAALAVLLPTLLACGTAVTVKPVDPVIASRQPEVGAVRSDRPSERTLQTLRLLALDNLLEQAPPAAFRAVDALRQESSDGSFLVAAAEIALLSARDAKAEGGDPREIAGWYLLAASRAFDYLLAPDAERPFDPQFQEMRVLYGRAVAGLVELLPELRGGFREITLRTSWETFELNIEQGSELWDPDHFDALLPVESLAVKGLRNHYGQAGLGAPLIAVRENGDREPEERFYPPEGIIRAATAVVGFETLDISPAGVRTSARLALYDPIRSETARLRGTEVPLAADFTTPYAYLLSRTDMKPGLLKPEKAWDHLGLFLLERYDREKIPVVMVHGLWSTPLAWMELTNDLTGDPELRAAYQIWHFMYPTALPYLYAGSLLRAALEDVRRSLDPEADDPAMGSMVVVAHSMGGLLARTLVTDSGSRLWSALITVPPEALQASPVDRALLRHIFFFQHLPYIHRVIFLAVPHGGSAMADSLRGKLAQGLARVPEPFTGLFQRLVRDNPGVVVPAMEKLLRNGGPNSIQALSPRHPVLQALAQLPLAEGVPYHTIVGNRGPVGKAPTTDGVVDYWSSHLPQADSEWVVPSGHAVYSHPVAIAEIKRILKQHLRERSVGPSDFRTRAPSP